VFANNAFFVCINTVSCFSCRLPTVEETILKRKKRIDAGHARQARANLRAKKVHFLNELIAVYYVYICQSLSTVYHIWLMYVTV